MSIKRNRTKPILYGITLVIALVILMDFTLPGTIYTEEVIDIKNNKEQYYNAGGNSHYSYKVITPKHQFSVSKDIAKIAQNKKITYSVSLLFKEVNKYRLLPYEKSSIYSFRIASGLALPLIVIFAILIVYKYKKKINTLLFVLQIILLANFIMLLL